MTTQPTMQESTTGRAAEVRHAVGEESGHVTRTAKDQAREVASEAKSQAQHLATEARERVRGEVGSQRDRLGGALAGFADELDQMADGAGGSGTASQLARQVAQFVRGLSDEVQGRDAGEVVEQVRSFARQKPGVFLLGAAAAGVVAGRATRGLRPGGDGHDAAGGGQVSEAYATDADVSATGAGPAYGAAAGTAAGASVTRDPDVGYPEEAYPVEGYSGGVSSGTAYPPAEETFAVTESETVGVTDPESTRVDLTEVDDEPDAGGRPEGWGAR